MFNWMRDRRRGRLAAEPFPDEWLQIIHRNCRHFVSLGLALTDEMRVTVAAQASLLGLGFGAPPFDRLISVIIQPEVYTGTKVERTYGFELHTEEQRLGEAWRNGPVLLSWQDIVRQCREFPDGRNVILHEFAHLLDMANSDVDGVPPLDTEEQYRTWLDVTRIEYRNLVRHAQRGRQTLLDWYGATSEAEFFAVATETFFEQPLEMQKLHPKLYDVLGAFYKQDPAARWLRLVA